MRAAFFDLDKTVIAKASIPAFGRSFRRGGLVSRRSLLRAAIFHLVYQQFGSNEERLARARRSMLEVTKGWERDRVRVIVRDALLKTIEPLIYSEALQLMEEHRRAGDRVYLVSASPEELVLPLAELLGADGAIASRGEIDAGGRYTGRLAFFADGPGKAAALRRIAERHDIDLAASSAYSDSATDLPMMEAVGRPVAVNADRALAKVAKERDWETMTFTKPVRLRDRMTVRTPAVTTSVALVVGAAVVLWRTLRARGQQRTRVAAAKRASPPQRRANWLLRAWTRSAA